MTCYSNLVLCLSSLTAKGFFPKEEGREKFMLYEIFAFLRSCGPMPRQVEQALPWEGEEEASKVDTSSFWKKKQKKGGKRFTGREICIKMRDYLFCLLKPTYQKSSAK